jgi:dihydrolipoamide dehydrogenase
MADKEYTITIFNSGQKEQIQTRNIVFATGSRARNNFMNIPISGNRIINSDHILNIKEIPKSLVIIGGGVVGCEFASVFSGFDTRITILENSDSILPMSDKDCRNTLTNVFKKNNIDIKASASVTNIIEDEKSITLSYNQGNQDFDIKADYCLIATGREANMDIFSSNIPQNKLNKIIDNGLFSVNKNMETSIPGLYAIGDCIKTPWLAHVASSEGIIAAESIASIANINFINYEKIPMCVYTSPSIAWCGLTEDKVDISSDYVKVSKFPLVKNGKAAIMLENEGFVKCITDRETNEILGFHIMGKNATELIAEPSFAMQFEATIEEIGASMHAHPTLYESIYEAALIALGKPLHG